MTRCVFQVGATEQQIESATELKSYTPLMGAAMRRLGHVALDGNIDSVGNCKNEKHHDPVEFGICPFCGLQPLCVQDQHHLAISKMKAAEDSSSAPGN